MGGLPATTLWFVFLFYSTSDARWDESIFNGFAWISAVAAMIIGFNAKAIYQWHSDPLRPSLIVTPIYIIETNSHSAWYWPITSISHFSATNHYRNGSYSHSAMTVEIAGKERSFRISKDGAYQEFVAKANQLLNALSVAADRGDQSYVVENDDFIGAAAGDPNLKTSRWRSALAVWVAAPILGLGLTILAKQINSAQPITVAPTYTAVTPAGAAPAAIVAAPIYNSIAPTDAAPAPDDAPMAPTDAAPAPNEAPSPYDSPPPVAERVDYIEAKLGGVSPPSVSSYIPGVEQQNVDGLGEVTVDNSRNDSDVLVKLVVTIGTHSFPVREFFIRAGGSFNVGKVSPGHYDIRYLERWSGAIAKSEPFDLVETTTEQGTEYSTMTMTLYKVANGNMQTYPIGPDEF